MMASVPLEKAGSLRNVPKDSICGLLRYRCVCDTTSLKDRDKLLRFIRGQKIEIFRKAGARTVLGAYERNGHSNLTALGVMTTRMVVIAVQQHCIQGCEKGNPISGIPERAIAKHCNT